MTDLPVGYVRVLDKGYVGLVDHMGDDYRPADAARVSFGKRANQFTDDQNSRLIKHLDQKEEFSCFRHNVFTFEMRMPLMVARQLWKYVVASNFTEDQLGWNENSRRYMTDGNEFYLPGPTEWRTAPDNKKQGSGAPVNDVTGSAWERLLKEHQERGEELYNKALSDGIAAEEARLFLPAYGLYVSVFWTVSLNALLHVLDERLGHTAQYEIYKYAEALETLFKQTLPVIHEVWKTHS